MLITITTPISNKCQYILFKKKHFPDFFKRPIKVRVDEAHDEIEFRKCYLDDNNTIKATPYKHYYRINLPLHTIPNGVYELDEEDRTEDSIIFTKKIEAE